MTLDALIPDQQPESVADVPLDENILNILGDEPAKEESFSTSIHNDIAVRWSEIFLNGLKEDTRKEILKSYDAPENLKLALPPILNPEIKAAVNESFIKRDGILFDKQKYLGCVISCLANLMSNMLHEKAVTNTNQATTTLKQLSDAGRLLCHLHNSETNTRKQFLMSGLSKNVKDNIKDQKRDQWLFGAELTEKLRSMKAISKTGAEMKATTPMVKPKAPPRNRQPEASTSRALNWRGPPPPQPRHAPTRLSSTPGGRRLPQVTSQRPAPHYRPARPQQQQTRRR